MAVLTLNWPDGPRWVMSVTLDRRVFTLRASYNTRMKTWTLDLITGDDEHLLSGVRVVKGYALLPGWRDERFPAGQLFAVSPGNRSRHDPRRDAFDDDFRLVYVEPDE